ncbi:hypothetical protein [uncultured Desulfobacter sp.]|uniref:hypothetical protein n=1 Tax=uncultured Desulfobacter sp. TaxID=240139 RepID=UPI0029F49B13|nr:hypothetical protein [uncultured Desulfobacter sp.]
MMAKNSRGKRPCSICRKWFAPDVRQKGRQRTCSPACQNELHRRQCENWNRKNKAVSKNNYLAKKLEEAESLQTSGKLTAFPSQTQKSPVLPMEVIETEYGIKPAIIAQYLVTQVISHTKEKIREFP